MIQLLNRYEQVNHKVIRQDIFSWYYGLKRAYCTKLDSLIDIVERYSSRRKAEDKFYDNLYPSAPLLAQ